MSGLVQLIETPAAMRAAVRQAQQAGRRVGFVPTMGALHAGHARLIETARAETDLVVVSIFVNPTQFGPGEDFARYPRTLEADRALCAAAGAELIFAPDTAAMYPPGFRTVVETPGLQDLLCGASRPGHFRGVCTVVAKLFHAVPADIAYFGQKDAQQLLIIERMVRDLDFPIVIRPVPTVREADGLALSSRNRYLTAAERAAAPALYRSLEAARAAIERGERDPQRIERFLADELARIPGLRLDYARAVSADTLETVAPLRGRVLLAVAAWFGATRLIDNIPLDLAGDEPGVRQSS